MIRYLHIAGYELPVWYLAHAVALLVSGQMGYLRLVRHGVRSDVATSAIAIIIGGGIASLYSLRWLADFAARRGFLSPAAASLGGGAVVIVIAGGVFGQIWWKRYSLPAGEMWDLVIVPVPLAQAIGRIGCFFAACCHGRPTTSRLGMFLPDHEGWYESRWPTQLYSLAGNLTIFAVLLTLERRRSRQAGGDAIDRWLFPGSLALIYLALFATKRFFVEFLRGSWDPILGPLSSVQIASLVILGVAVVWIAAGSRSKSSEL